MSNTLSFVITNDTYPSFKPLTVNIDEKNAENVKNAIIKLIYMFKKSDECYIPDDGVVIEEKLIMEDINLIVNDLCSVDQHVFGYNKYYCVALAINKDPCIVWSKGIGKRKYNWDNHDGLIKYHM